MVVGIMVNLQLQLLKVPFIHGIFYSEKGDT
jgi:hypothetical protein